MKCFFFVGISVIRCGGSGDSASRDVLYGFDMSFDDDRLGGTQNRQNWERTFGNFSVLMPCLFIALHSNSKENVIAGLDRFGVLSKLLEKVSVVSIRSLFQLFICF